MNVTKNSNKIIIIFSFENLTKKRTSIWEGDLERTFRTGLEKIYSFGLFLRDIKIDYLNTNLPIPYMVFRKLISGLYKVKLNIDFELVSNYFDSIAKEIDELKDITTLRNVAHLLILCTNWDDEVNPSWYHWGYFLYDENKELRNPKNGNTKAVVHCTSLRKLL